MGFHSLIVFLFVFHLFLVTLCDPKCPKSFPCKDVGTLEYPFTDLDLPDCGLIEVDCNSSSTLKNLKFGNEWTQYDVVKVNIASHELMVRDNILKADLDSRNCSSFTNISPLPLSPFISFTVSQNLTLFTCNTTSVDRKYVEDYFEHYKEYRGCNNFTIYYRNPAGSRETGLPLGCSLIQLPMRDTANWSDDDLFKLLSYEYSILWHVSYYDPTKGIDGSEHANGAGHNLW